MNTSAPDVSVVMPLHNAEAYVLDALRQIESIDFQSLEIVIVDDGSSDSTSALLKAWAQATSLNHKILHSQTPEGVAAARNRAVQACQGQFIWFVDCDDEWSANIIRDLWKSVEFHGSDIAICNAERRVTSTGSSTQIEDAPKEHSLAGQRALELLLTGRLQGHLWNKLFRKSLVSKNPFPPTRAHSDLGGVISMLADADKVSFVPVTNYIYKVRAGSILHSSSYRWDDLRDCASRAEATVEKLGNPKDLVKGVYRFQFTHILIPLANERIRREGSYSPRQLPFTENVTAKAIVGLIRAGDARLGLRIFVITRVPHLYARLYRSYNQRRWGELLA